MKNIIYSTTRQWNCGDEFILMGCINLLKEVIGEHNAIIYNRNPDIRPENGQDIWYRNYKMPRECYLANGALFRYGFHDNSVKFNSDLSYADLVVFAGSPEWLTSRCTNLYSHIIKNGIPVLILGVGGYDEPTEDMKEVISKSLLLTVRDKNLLNIDFIKNNNAVYEACPALFAAASGEEKVIAEVSSIGLNYQTNYSNSVKNNCIDDEAHDFCVELYRNIIENYKDKKVSVICHYIDELSAAYSIFKDYDVEILYSYDSKDYINIYKKFDLVVSPRVHGSGMASSLGIPNFIIKHDKRGATADAFLPEEISIGEDFALSRQKIDNVIANASQYSQRIISNKKSAFERYSKMIKNVLSFEKIQYKEQDEEQRPAIIEKSPVLN